MAKNPYQRPDHFTRDAKRLGYPARSIFKLEEIDRRVGLIRQGHHILDLGAAPGSWSMYATTRIGGNGRLLAIDLAPLANPLPRNGEFLQGDALILDPEVLGRFAPYDVVLSDMAPNTSGMRETDHARSLELFLRAVDVAVRFGKPASAFVGKLFMGEGFEEARAHVRKHYDTTKIIRPEGTRKSSVEIFVVGLGKKPAVD